jgi:hypothetical protein
MRAVAPQMVWADRRRLHVRPNEYYSQGSGVSMYVEMSAAHGTVVTWIASTAIGCLETTATGWPSLRRRGLANKPSGAVAYPSGNTI